MHGCKRNDIRAIASWALHESRVPTANSFSGNVVNVIARFTYHILKPNNNLEVRGRELE